MSEANSIRAMLIARGPQIATAVLAIALAAQAAFIVVGLGMRKAAIAPSVSIPPPSTPALDVAQIVNAHLFGSAATPAASGDAANAPSTTLALVLAGLLAADDPKEGYAIIGENAASAKVVSVGEEVPGGAKLHSVYRDRAVIERAGTLESVYLPQGAGGAIGGTAPPPVAASAPLQSPLLDRMRKLVNEQPGLLSTVIRPQPVYSGGKLRGFRVYPGANRQSFTRLGLRPGDLVTAINGTPLDDPARGEEIFGTLGSATDARVTVTRNGRSEDLALNLTQVAAEAEALTGTEGMIPADQMPQIPGEPSGNE
jgi:general secretion pathway protein C